MINGAPVYTEGDNMNLICEASEGNPDHYDYTWTFVPKYGGSNLTFHSQKSLTRDTVGYSDAGTYICTAKNIAGENVESKDITIKCKIIDNS